MTLKSYAGLFDSDTTLKFSYVFTIETEDEIQSVRKVVNNALLENVILEFEDRDKIHRILRRALVAKCTSYEITYLTEVQIDPCLANSEMIPTSTYFHTTITVKKNWGKYEITIEIGND